MYRDLKSRVSGCIGRSTEYYEFLKHTESGLTRLKFEEQHYFLKLVLDSLTLGDLMRSLG